MDTIIIHPENEEQQQALRLILEGLKVPFEQEPSSDATEYLTSTKANKAWLNQALAEDRNREGVELNPDDLWK
jgi:hypothetical protein